jgi:hypothetical protein
VTYSPALPYPRRSHSTHGTSHQAVVTSSGPGALMAPPPAPFATALSPSASPTCSSTALTQLLRPGVTPSLLPSHASSASSSHDLNRHGSGHPAQRATQGHGLPKLSRLTTLPATRPSPLHRVALPLSASSLPAHGPSTPCPPLLHPITRASPTSLPMQSTPPGSLYTVFAPSLPGGSHGLANASTPSLMCGRRKWTLCSLSLHRIHWQRTAPSHRLPTHTYLTLYCYPSVVTPSVVTPSISVTSVLLLPYTLSPCCIP